jgi:pyrroloquinoline quinone biosynthesis protein D
MTFARMTPDSPCRVPSLAASSRLYFDPRHQRWVVKAPHQVVFLDPVSLDVLRACDGQRNLAQVALCLEGLGHRPGRAWLDVVQDIVRHFEARGVLHCTRPEGAFPAPRDALQSLAGRLLEGRSSTK